MKQFALAVINWYAGIDLFPSKKTGHNNWA